MDRDYVIRHDIVERYLRGQLSAEESAAFEEHCLWCHESLDELELAERMRQGFKDLAQSTEIRPSGRLVRMLRSPQYAAAASVLLAVSLLTSGVLYYEHVSSPESGFATAQVYSLETHRGSSGSSAQRIGVAGPDARVVLVVYPDGTAGASYRVSLHRADEMAPIWQDSTVHSAGDTLAVMLPGRLLTPGDYRLRVEDATTPPGSAAAVEVEFTAFDASRVR